MNSQHDRWLGAVMGYLYLILSIVFEILGMVAMKNSEGFTKPIPSILLFVFYVISYIGLTLTLKTLPMSMVYTLWAGIGTVAMALVARFYYSEELAVPKYLAMSLIVLGVIMFQYTDNKEKEMAMPAKLQDPSEHSKVAKLD